MKLKYYLRGLGIGVVVTALLMGLHTDPTVSAQNGQEQSVEDATTKESFEAEEEMASGVIEETTMETSLIIEETEELSEETEEVSSQAETESAADESQMQTEDAEELTTQMASFEDLTVPEDAKEAYILNIVRGDDSGTVARKLQTAGLVENASEFDAFLMQHGYDKKISVGIVEIPLGATWVEIADKLSGN